MLNLWRGVVFTMGVSVASLPTLRAEDLIIDNVTVIDGTGSAALPGQTVVVRDGRFATISKTKNTSVRKGLRVDGTGKYLIPGLFDVHVHVPYAPDSASNGLPDPGITSLHSFLYSGVTTIFDAGNFPDYIMRLRAEARAGTLISPRIFATGTVVTYPKSWSASAHAILVESWPKGATDVDVNLARQPDFQKITYENFGAGANSWVPSFSPELFTSIAQYVMSKGVRPVVHISDEAHARVAIDAGVDRLAHSVAVSKMSPDFAALVAAKHVMTATTLAVFDNIARVTDDPSFLDSPSMTAVMEPKQIEDLKKGRSNYIKIGWGSWFKSTLKFSQDNIRQLHEAGALLALGTDRALGPLVQRELELIVGAGIPPVTAIRIATLNGAIYLGQDAVLGSIAPGKYADMVLLNADPTADIRNITQIAAVYKAGRKIDRSTLNLPINRK